jgi:hypothetical protein
LSTLVSLEILPLADDSPAVRSLAIVTIVAACGDNAPPLDAPDTTFDYHATAGWYSRDTPTVLAVAIDGTSIADGETVTLDRVFSSEAEARATFRAPVATVTTALGTGTFTLAIAGCLAVYRPVLVRREADEFWVGTSNTDPSGADFSAFCGECVDSAGVIYGWCAHR